MKTLKLGLLAVILGVALVATQASGAGAAVTPAPAPAQPSITWVTPTQLGAHQTGASPNIGASPNVTVYCTNYLYPTALDFGEVYARGYTQCTPPYPTLSSMTLTIWAYYSGGYHQDGGSTDTTVPAPTEPIDALGSPCQHGWIYHAELTSTSYYGNWSSRTINNTATTLC